MAKDAGGGGESPPLITMSSTSFLKTNTVHIFLTFLTALLNYLPLLVITNSHLEDGTILHATILEENRQYEYSSIVVLTLVPPLILDSLIDFFATKRKIITERNDDERSESMTFPEKTAFLLGCTAHALCPFLPKDYDKIALLDLCSESAMVTLVLGGVWTALSRYCPKYWHPTLAGLGIVVFGIGNLLGTFGLNYTLADPHDGGSYAIATVGGIAFYAGVIIFLVPGFAWMYNTFRQPFYRWLRLSKVAVTESFVSSRLDPNVRTKKPDSKMEKSLDFYPQMFITGVMLYIFGVTLASGFLPSYDNMTVSSLCGVHVGLAVGELMLLMFSLRRIKFESVQRLYALVDAKKSYVRYISHELRTPLNAAYLGLELVLGELKDSSDPSDVDRYDTLSDVSQSCHSAVEILNDLLCFDKIESGILELFKTDVQLIPFLKDGVAMFTAQARARRVNLILDVTDPVVDIAEIARSVRQSPYSAKFGIGPGFSAGSHGGATASATVSTAAPTGRKSVNRRGTHVLGAVLRSVWSTVFRMSVSSLGGGGDRRKDSSRVVLSNENSGDSPEGLSEGDEIAMDRFKMDQVLRNLISNALKFTPSGGTVTVRAVFVPDVAVLKPRESYLARRMARLRESMDSTLRGRKDESARSYGSGRAGGGPAPGRGGGDGTLVGAGEDAQPQEICQLLPYLAEEVSGARVAANEAGNHLLTSQKSFASLASTHKPLAPSVTPSNLLSVSGDSRKHLSASGRSLKELSMSGRSNSKAPSVAGSSLKQLSTRSGLLSNSIRGISARMGRSIGVGGNRRSSSSAGSTGGGGMVKGKLRISVTDTGAGISPENQKRLFKEVVQFNPEILQAGGGSGFGLFITHNIVALHGGRISVFSEGEGKGSTFTVEIPMTKLRDAGGKARNSYSSRIVFTGGSSSSPLPVAPSPPQRSPAGSSRSGLLRTSMSFKTTIEQSQSQNRPDRTLALAGKTAGSGRSDCSSLSGGGGRRAAGGGGGGDSTVKLAEPLVVEPIRRTGSNIWSDAGTAHEVESKATHHSGAASVTDTKTQAKVEDKEKDMDKNKLRLRVLVVDDSLMNRKMLSKVLQSKGHECEQAEDGEIAVQMVRDRLDAVNTEAVSPNALYDAILMDFVMPNMDGPTATRHIRDLGFSNPIYGVTGNALDTDIERFMSSGATKVLPKPFNVAAFEEIMAERRKPSAAALLQMSSKAYISLSTSSKV